MENGYELTKAMKARMQRDVPYANMIQKALDEAASHGRAVASYAADQKEWGNKQAVRHARLAARRAFLVIGRDEK